MTKDIVEQNAQPGSRQDSDGKGYRTIIEQYSEALSANHYDVGSARCEDLGCRLRTQDAMLVETEHYATLLSERDEDLFEMYSGYAQCIGNLVTDGHRVVISCCKSMTESVVYGHAHMHNGHLFINDRDNEYSVLEDGSVLCLKGKKAQRVDACPYCGASLTIIPGRQIAEIRKIISSQE